VESIAGIAVVSCGLKRHLQILVIGYVRYRCWVLIYLTIASYGDETLLMKEKNRGIYQTKHPDENKNWNVSRTCKKSDRSNRNKTSKKQKLEQRNVKEELIFARM